MKPETGAGRVSHEADTEIILIYIDTNAFSIAVATRLFCAVS